MSAAQPVRIEPGQKAGRPLAEGATHPYLVRLEAGEYVRIAAEQRGVDLVLRLVAPGGDLIAEVDSPTGTQGAERVSEVAAVSGDYRAEVVGGEGTTPGAYEIQIEEKGPATEAHRRRVEAERVFQDGEGLRRDKKYEDAIARYERALTLSKEAGDPGGEAAALVSIGWMKEYLDRWEEAAGLCSKAARLFQQAGDPRGQARALNRYGRMLIRLGRYREARQPLEDAVRLFRAAADPESEARALNSLGNVQNSEGRFDLAVDTYTGVLEIWRRLNGSRDEAIAVLSLGNLYLEHGKWTEAQNNFKNALRIAEAIADDGLAADALDGLHEVAYREGRLVESRAQSEQALALYRKLGDRRSQAITLISVGSVLLKTKEPQEAQARFSEALGLFRAVEDAHGEAMATAHLARAALARGEARQALHLGQDALTRFEKLGYRYGLSLTHYVIAQALLQLKDPDKALREVEASIDLAENQRAETGSLETRASYFATRQHYWELYIDVLLAQDRMHPNQGYAARALEADEKRRARSLLDALAEVRAEVRQHADPTLLREEEEVQRLLDHAVQSEEAEALLARLDRVRTRMRQASPQLARLEESKTLSVAEIQKRLLDTDTLLLVYSLGEERSVLWRLTRSNLAFHQLPGRERIETAALLARDFLSRRLRPGANRRQKAVDDLAALVFKPVAADLPKYKRLLIVADGALQLIPFAALPDPAAVPAAGRRPFLVESHSIIHLPSASVGAALRQERQTGPLRQPGPLIAVLADPVFDASDPRVHPGSAPPPKREVPRGHLTRSLNDLGLSDLEPLPFSLQEAEAIRDLWRPGEVLPALGFAASREVLDDERWRQAPILHFATHGLLNDRQPELSGLVFSLVGPDGAPRSNGFLRLYEIYGLDLNADLVVLSACQTAVGKEVRGEGLLGMTWGFMSIGVPQLVASLWKVEDRATAKLMSRFYRELFNGKRPPEALQHAQKSMLGEPAWSDPSLWAGFIFQGDYDKRPGGGIEATDSGGNDPAKRAGTGGLPPPKVRPPRPTKANPPEPPR